MVQPLAIAGRGFGKTLYRRAARRELRANGWSVGAFLVVDSRLLEAARGAGKAILPVPLGR